MPEAEVSARPFQSARAPVGLLWLITGCLMLQPLSTDLYLASMPHLATYFRASPALVQQTLSLFVLGLAGAQLISGPLSDRYGRRPVLIWGLVVYVAASVACAFAPSMAALIVGRFVQAIGCCTAVVTARAIVRDAYDPTTGAHVIAKASSMLAFAPLLGPIAGSYLQVAFGWRAAFAVLAVAGLVVGAATLWSFAETNERRNLDALRPAAFVRNYAAVLAAPGFWAYALPGALSFGSIFVFVSGASFLLIRVLGVATEYFGYCFAFGVLGYLLGTLVCRRLLRERGTHGTLRLGGTTGLAAGLLFAGTVAAGVQHWATLLLCQFLVMFTYGINFPCAQTGAVAPFGDKAGAAAGLLGCITMLTAFAVGTVMAGLLEYGIGPVSWLSATLGVGLFAAERALAPCRDPRRGP